LRHIPCLLRDVHEGACAGHRELEAFGDPRGGGGRTVIPVGLAALRLTQELHDVALERSPPTEEVVEMGAKVGIGHRRHRGIAGCRQRQDGLRGPLNARHRR
jgi:hypothetical protein